MKAAGRVIMIFALVAAPSAIACLWDYDTLRDERRGLPGIAEVLAGKWEKHSPFFYDYRVKKMRELIEKEPQNWPAYDNLAVALEKLGEFDDAIQVMLTKEQLNPRQYTTYANLGTFYLHTGRLDDGIVYIRKALAINPEAHFGREEYQLKLAEFLRDAGRNPRLAQTMNFLHIAEGRIVDPETYPPLSQPATEPSDDDESNLWAIRSMDRGSLPEPLKENVFDGIVGMIRFGTGKSAELYLTLGDLLAMRGDKHLAYRAYQRALDLQHPRQDYLQSVMRVLKKQSPESQEFAAERIAAERAAADAWVTAYQQYEDDLIRVGKDPEDESNLADFYAKHGQAVMPLGFELGDHLPRQPFVRTLLLLAVVLVALLLILCVWLVRSYRRRRSRVHLRNV